MVEFFFVVARNAFLPHKKSSTELELNVEHPICIFFTKFLLWPQVFLWFLVLDSIRNVLFVMVVFIHCKKRLYQKRLKFSQYAYLANFISKFILLLQSEVQVKLSKFNSDFSNKILVSCFKLLKMYSPRVFLKTDCCFMVLKA